MPRKPRRPIYGPEVIEARWRCGRCGAVRPASASLRCSRPSCRSSDGTAASSAPMRWRSVAAIEGSGPVWAGSAESSERLWFCSGMLYFMSDWGSCTYGDPCRECGFRWSLDVADAEVLVAGAPTRLLDLLDGASGDERHPDLTWSVSAYVCHVSDNLRIWAERLAGIALGGPTVVASYDENQLAAARVYDSISLGAALWSLERAVRDWLEAVDTAPAHLVMHHPDRGSIGLEDIVRSNAHDVTHHELDITHALTR